MFFSQDNMVIPLCSVGTKVSTAPTMDSFNMKGYDHATLFFLMGPGASCSQSLYLNCASSDGGDTLNAMVHYRVADGAVNTTSAGTLGAVASASVVPVASGDKNVMYVVEIDAEDLPAASRTYEWITASLSGGVTGDMVAFAVLSRPRYSDNIMNNALA